MVLSCLQFEAIVCLGRCFPFFDVCVFFGALSGAWYVISNPLAILLDKVVSILNDNSTSSPPATINNTGLATLIIINISITILGATS